MERREPPRPLERLRNPLVLGVGSIVGLLATWNAHVPFAAMATACVGGVVAGALAAAAAGHKFAGVAVAVVGSAVMSLIGPLSAWSAAALWHLLLGYVAAMSAAVLLAEGIRAARRSHASAR